MSARPAALLAVLLVACTGGAEPGSGTSEQSTQAQDGSSTQVVVDEVDGDGLTCWTAAPSDGDPGISFSDQTEAMGLVAPLVGIYGHAAVWGDITGDHRPDLFVGTFADRDAEVYQARGAEGPAPDRFLHSGEGSFAVDDALPDMFSRTSGGAVADLDNDGDLDLVLSRNFDDDLPSAPGVQLLRNDGGSLVPVEGSGLPAQLGGRSVGYLDYDLDGLLDVFIAADDGGSVLLRNTGSLSFTDVTAEAGLPVDVFALGVGIADLTGDGQADIFLAGSNRLFVSDGASGFTEVDGSVFQWDFFGEEDLISGVSIADVNRDGLLDIAVGHHFNSTIDDGTRVPVRLYLNRGSDGSGTPTFEDVTEAAGLVGLPTKGPHVEINDMDNDGWPDLITTASASDGTRPAIFRHEGLNGDIPTFSVPDGLGHPQYWVAGPSADVDRDGRLDLFLLEWNPALPSLLMRNETASGHWLEVAMGPEHGFGLGWRVEVYASDTLIGAREITVTQGYSAGVAPVAHFGLGDHNEVDVRLVSPGRAETVELPALTADQHLRYPAACN